MKIKFKNFQSLRSEEVNIRPGMTLITGPTNSGKTAIFRGLLALLTNSVDAPNFINGIAVQENGDNAELSVSLIDEDIPKIEFHRNKSKAWYMIDGKKYSKLARSNIFDIYPDLRRKFIYDPQDSRKVLNFQTEEQLAFPFDKSDGEMFKLFEHIFNITDTRLVIDTMKKEEDEVNFKLSQNQSEKQNLTEKTKILEAGLYKINKEFLLNYADQYKKCANSAQKCLEKIYKISEYAPFLTTCQQLPILSSNDNGEIFSAVIDLGKKLQECQLKSEYITNYTDLELSGTEEDFGSPVLELESKLNKISTLSKNLIAIEQSIADNEQILKQAEEKLKEFDICPLCGHKLEENNVNGTKIQTC